MQVVYILRDDVTLLLSFSARELDKDKFLSKGQLDMYGEWAMSYGVLYIWRYKLDITALLGCFSK